MSTSPRDLALVNALAHRLSHPLDEARVLESALHTLGELLELDTGWASHLAMLEPLSGREHIESAYDAALAAKYLWHEFGDVHLLMPERRLDG